MARLLWGLATNPALVLPSGRISAPVDRIWPGAVARSVLAGCCALNLTLREVHSDAANQLAGHEPAVDLDPKLGLFLAATRGPEAWVTGGMSGFTLLRSPNRGAFSWAQIYFPPLVWQLVQREQMSLLVEQRWVDVSSWLAYPPDHSARFVDLVSSLSVVKHPRHDPRIANDWSELLHDESCFMVESENATRREWIG